MRYSRTSGFLSRPQQSRGRPTPCVNVIFDEFLKIADGDIPVRNFLRVVFAYR